MKKWTILILALVFVVLYLHKTSIHNIRLVPEKEILREPQITPPPNLVPAFIDDLNLRNRGIRSIWYDHLKLRVRDRLTVRLSGSLAYEKPKKFHMRLESILGEELLVGSNNQHFWFWSRRMDPPALYYCDHANTYRSRLKTPFHPIWIMESLGLGQVSVENAKLDAIGPYWKVTEVRISTLGKKVLKTTLIDVNAKAIVGHYIHDGNQLIVSSEVEEFYKIKGHIVPKRIRTIWHEEGVELLWNFSEPVLNQSMGDVEMPDQFMKIDLAI
jgi:hypothetical protein